MEEPTGVIGRHIHLIVEPMQSHLRERPIVRRLALANAIPEEVIQDDDFIILSNRQNEDPGPNWHWFKRRREKDLRIKLFARKNLRVMQAKAYELLHLHLHLHLRGHSLSQSVKVLAIGPNRRFPLLIRLIRLRIVLGVELNEKFWSKKLHHWIRPIFEKGFHKMCGRLAVWDRVGSALGPLVAWGGHRLTASFAARSMASASLRLSAMFGPHTTTSCPVLLLASAAVWSMGKPLITSPRPPKAAS